MNNGNAQVKADLKKAFPFLTNFKHFLYIDVSTYNFDDNWTAIVGYISLLRRSALVIFDDAHKMFKKEEESKVLKFYNKLNEATGVKCIVLLSSQGPPPKHTYLKDTEILYKSLYELGKIEAIVQLQKNIHLKKKINPSIPLSLSRLIAHRLWFYLGGNFRAVKDLLGKVAVSIDDLRKQAGDMAQNETVKQDSKTTKMSLFPVVLEYMKAKHQDLKIENLIDLDFSAHYYDEEENSHQQKSTAQQSANPPSNLVTLIDNNILITQGTGQQKKIRFHSRRTQFAFNRWLGFDYPQYLEEMKGGGHQARLNFLKLLESTECRHILSFPLLPFLEILEMKRVSELEIMKNISPKKSEEQKNGKSIKYLGVEVNPVLAKSVVELMEAQLKLVMLYFESYQEVRKLDSFKPSNHQLKAIMDDLKKGHAHFFTTYRDKFKMSKEQKNEMIQLQGEMREKSTAEVLKMKNQILGALYGQCVSDFMELGQFEKEGVSITEEDLKNCDRDVKYNDIKKEIEKVYGQKPMTKTRKEMLLMGLDLIVDLNYHMKYWDQEPQAEGAQKGKADKGAKQ